MAFSDDAVDAEALLIRVVLGTEKGFHMPVRMEFKDGVFNSVISAAGAGALLFGDP